MILLISVLTSVVVVASLLPLSRNPHWIIRSLDFPRLQLATYAALLLLLQLLLLDFNNVSAWLLSTAVALCLGWHLWWILPYTRLWPVEVLGAKQPDAGQKLSIITANVLMTNRDAKPLLALVEQHKPDVLVTLESDQWWQQKLDSLDAEMPYSIKCPLDNMYGMHVYSRLPLSDTAVSFLVEDNVPSMHALLHLRNGEQVQIHFLHPAPPSPTENEKSAERDAELVIVARSVADNQLPTIVTGDLNDVAWSRSTRLFRKLSGLLDPRIGRGMFNTFHASYPFLRWPLDHLFHSEHFTVQAIRRLPNTGSDHFALLTQLDYSAQQSDKHDGLNAEQADHELATDMANAKHVNKTAVPNSNAAAKLNPRWRY